MGHQVLISVDWRLETVGLAGKKKNTYLGLTSLCSGPFWAGPGWGSPLTPFEGSAGSSRACGGRQGTRRRAAGGRDGLD